jgi:hypothetical protein
MPRLPSQTESPSNRQPLSHRPRSDSRHPHADVRLQKRCCAALCHRLAHTGYYGIMYGVTVQIRSYGYGYGTI